jgi:hypothetical protein
MARLLGDAFVGIKTTGERQFVMDTKRMADVASKAAKVMVKAGLDPRGAQTGLDRLKTQADGLIKALRKMPADVDDKMARAALLSMQVQADKLVASLADIPADADTRPAEAKFLRLEARFDKMRARLSEEIHVDVDVDVKKGLLSRLGGLFGGGGAAGGGGGLMLPIQGLTGGIPVSGGGGLAVIAAGLAALPFIAQTAAGGIVAALGGGLATLAIIGAAKTRQVRDAFGALTKSIGADVTKIGASFAPVITHILASASILADDLTPVFTRAAQTIAPAVQTIGDALIKAFDQPAVKQSIQAVAQAFAAILNALAPSIPGMIKGIADGVKSIAHAVSDNPKAFADFVKFLFAAAEGALKTIAWLTKVATYIEQHLVPAFKRARHDIAHWWDDLTNDIAKTWDITSESVGIGWDKIELFFIGGVRFIVGLLARLPGPLGQPFRKWKDDLGGIMTKIQADISNRTGQIQRDIDSITGKIVNVQVIAEAKGTGTISITGSGWAFGQGNIRFHAAAGGMISGGTPGKDSVLGMLMPGEVVVPTALVNAGAVDHLKGRLPGFAGGGLVGGIQAAISGIPGPAGQMTGADAGRAVHTGVAEAMAKARAAVVARAQQPNPFAGITGIPSGQKIGASAAAAMKFAQSILWAYGWTQAQWPSLRALWMGESGWRWDAYNGASGATGIPQALPGSKMASAGADWRTNPATQIRWGLGYIKSVYGSPANAYGRWLARSPHWYSEGGLVPGYASGGLVARQGQSFLNAWRSRRGGGFGAAWGYIPVNQQIAAMQAAMHRNTILAHATGLTSRQHKHYAALAADERKRLVTLNRELGVERTWRGQLGSTDTTLQSYISAAGATPALKKNVIAWRAQITAHKHTISEISRMLGYSDAYLKAHPPAPVLPPVRHVYGGDIGDTIAAYLAGALAPLGLATGGLVADQGTTLAPGWNARFNATGRNEHLVPAGTQNVQVTISFDESFQRATGLTQRELANIRKTVQINGGDVQTTLGSKDIKFVRR